ncbi:hypothetical protein VHUM_02035 [Vanrija humicola]|uniref:Amino acid permease/ SLC12A domain-containing protein n=1 Tax=Vanrija humicola TaxID=5417 RepID=A0A7D8V027_VANHU|nr:hypothetical protein VHUM_02035 [Vanrija humicola]
MVTLDKSDIPAASVIVGSGGEKDTTTVNVHNASHGHYKEEGELRRGFSLLSCLGLAFAILNSWNGESASAQIVLPSGGSVAMLWGLVVSALATLTMAVSFAEVCHVYPLTGGQLDWTYLLVPEKYRTFASFFVGWMGSTGWISLAASASIIVSNFLSGIIVMWNEDFELKSWQSFLFYLAATIVSWCLNAFGLKILPTLDRIAGVWSMAGIVVVSITILACSSGRFAKAADVFANFNNETGWPDGLAFLLGLLQSVFGLTGFDAVSHMVDEVPRPARTAPMVMVMSICLGAISAFIYLVIFLFCAQDFNALVSSPTGPILQVFLQSTKSMGGTPVNAITFVCVWIVVLGCIQLGSSVAFNAIIASSVVFLQISYIIPMAALVIRGQACLEGNHHQKPVWSLGRFRRVINVIALAMLVLTTVIFTFPPAIPVNGESMNYVVVVLGVAIILCLGTWFVDGRKNYHGPRDIEARLAMAATAL